VTARVLFVDHAGVLGGAEFSLLDVIDAFVPQAEVVLFADGPFRDAIAVRGVPVHVESIGALATVKKAGGMPSVAALVDVVRLGRQVAARAKAFGLIYANSQKAFMVSGVAGWLSNRPVVWHLRDILAPPHFSGANVRAAIWLANRVAARVIANSHATAQAFVAAGGNPRLVQVVHNGIDAAPFDAVTDEATQAVRAALGVPRDVPLVIHVGRFHHWKGQQVLLRALARERRAHAWIVGAPLFGEETFAAELRAECTKLGLDDRVQFLGFRDDVPTLIKAADMVVHSSVYPEPFGRVVVEGMLAGRPVIAARGGGVGEIVTDGETGLLIPPDQPEALAAAIGRVIDDPAAAAVMAARGAAHARRAFTRAAMVRGVAAVVAATGGSADRDAVR
jgi:glycosyltransferase involved in cell wall biosynthesis